MQISTFEALPYSHSLHICRSPLLRHSPTPFFAYMQISTFEALPYSTLCIYADLLRNYGASVPPRPRALHPKPLPISWLQGRVCIFAPFCDPPSWRSQRCASPLFSRAHLLALRAFLSCQPTLRGGSAGLSRSHKREIISDIWGKRGATYGEKAACRRIKKTKKENSFLTYGGNGVRHMGKRRCVGELKKRKKRINF